MSCLEICGPRRSQIQVMLGLMFIIILIVVGKWSSLRINSNTLWLKPNDSRVSSQLNGSHGEWTESDDVKKQNISKGTENARAAARRIKNAARAEATAANIVENEVEELPLPEIKLVVMYASVTTGLPIYGLGENKSLVTPIVIAGVQRYFDTSGMEYHNIRYQGDFAVAKIISPGFYETAPGLDPIMLMCPFALHETTVTTNGIPEAHRGIVLIPLLDELKTRFPGVGVSQQNIIAMLAFTTQRYGQIPEFIRSETVRAFAERIRTLEVITIGNNRIQHELRKRNDAKPVHERSIIPSYSDDSVDEFISVGIDPQSHHISRENASVNNLRDPTNNNCFSIINCKGYTPGGEHAFHGQFDTPGPGVARWYRTTFAQFRSHQPERCFVVYDNDPVTAINATGRMYKARPDEDKLKIAQLLITELPYCDDVQSHVSNSPYRLELQRAKNAEAELFSGRDRSIMARVNDAIRHRYYCGDERSVFDRGDGFLDACCFNFNCFFLLVGAFTMYLLSAVYYKAMFLTDTRHVFATMAAKRKLYLRYYYALFYHIEEESPYAQPEAKVKFETGKVGKLARLFVSYGDVIIYGGWIYDSLKTFLCRSWDLNLARSTHTIYKALKNDVWCPTEPGIHYRSFSDDMEIYFNVPGCKTRRITFDISSCDTSNGIGNFAILGFQMLGLGLERSFKGFMTTLKRSIILRNPIAKSEFIEMKPRTAFMGSGDGCTTHLNNIYQANNVLAIDETFLEIAQHGWTGVDNDRVPRPITDMTDDDIIDAMHYAVSLNGCKATIAVCPTLQSSDFLKTFICHSTCGATTTMLCLGAILRNFGKFRGDVDSSVLGITPTAFRRLSSSEVMERFLSGVVNGLCNEPSNIILDALRGRFSNRSAKIQEERYMESTSRSRYHIPLEQLQERYGQPDYEWVLVAKEIEKMSLGSVISSPVITAIFEKDYSL